MSNLNMTHIKEMQEKRNRVVAQIKMLVDEAENKRTGLSAMEQEQYDRLFTEATDLRFHLDAALRIMTIEDDLQGKRYNDPGAEYRHAMRKHLIGSRLSAEEARALSAGNEGLGGFLAAPAEWSASLIAAVTNITRVRQLATKHTITVATSFVDPTVENDFDDPDWLGENDTLKLDGSFSAGKRQLTPHLLTKGVIVSNRLLRASAGLAENVVIDRLSYKVAVAEEKGFLTGNGVNQPLGVFVTSTQGIPSSRDIVVQSSAPDPGSGSTVANVIGAYLVDALLDAKYSLKAQYWPRSEWFLHRDVLKVVAKLKDGDGNYIYHASEDPRIPDVLLGRPINLSEYAPNIFSSGNYLAILGDFSWYSICDLQDMEIKIMNELYALNSQTGVIIREYTDGMPVLAEAFARVQVQ